MALSVRSPSPSPSLGSLSNRSSSSSSTDSLDTYPGAGDAGGESASRPGSPAPMQGQIMDMRDSDTVTCLWEDCGKVFNHLPTLIEHIHNDHIGVHKSNYTCEWATCNRRGLAQTSRFALISHIRSHTGEKPFICPRPECDKSFTRSDALAKHMRLQHNISPPLPGRGGNRKRKREEADREQSMHMGGMGMGEHAFGPGGPAAGYATLNFKLDDRDPSSSVMYNNDDEISPLEYVGNGQGPSDYFSYPSTSHLAHPHAGANGAGAGPRSPHTDTDEEEGDDSNPHADLPPHVLHALDPSTGLVHGRPVAMVKYLLLKAKFNFQMEQHESLVEELRVARAEETAARREKEEALDELLRSSFGSTAEHLITANGPVIRNGPPPLPMDDGLAEL